MHEPLKNCPFCGEAAKHSFNSLYGDMSMASCKSCGATAYAPKWNRRAVLAKWGQPAPATQQPEGGVVAYLDVGVGGYLDLGSELSEDALQQLPKGRHALVIAGTYGIDGYTAASTPQSAPAGVLEDAARWHWMAEYIVGTRTDLDDELIACPTGDELRKLVDADLAARKQGGV